MCVSMRICPVCAHEGTGSGSSPIDGHMVLSIALCYGQTATKCLGVTGVTFKSDEAPLCVLSLALSPAIIFLFLFNVRTSWVSVLFWNVAQAF